VSVCIFGTNLRDSEQLHALGASLRAVAPNALIAIDEEGGEVTRLHYLEGSPYPGAAIMGQLDDTAYTERIGERVAHDVLSAGFNLVLGPVADVNSNPRNPVIGTRSFGADAALASRHVAAWVRGLEGAGAVSCPKHFPGHGDTAQDSHLALPVVDADAALLAERDLPPFRAAFDAGARTVMTSHILLPEIDPSGPATFSRAILHDILREQLGFTGLIVTDALDMKGASGEVGIPEAAVRALAAGCELLCLGTDNTREQLREIEDHVLAAVREGRLDAEIPRRAAQRVRALAEQAGQQLAQWNRSGRGAPAPPEAAEIARVAESFSGLETAREWLRAHPDAGVIRVDTTANIAVSAAPWGPFAAAAHPLPGTQDAARSFSERPLHPVDDATPLPWSIERAGSGVIVIGRELHRRAFAREGIDALRAAGTPVLTVETGWPGHDTVYAELACYGSSALAGAALLTLLASVPIEGRHS
ncbi:MAG: glycoside hydrolase family 3 protein, partial [Actinobacteria bacterium]|nr:glycoside hydrolase family 3 protein [Actinomycetota bacterium]